MQLWYRTIAAHRHVSSMAYLLAQTTQQDTVTAPLKRRLFILLGSDNRLSAPHADATVSSSPDALQVDVPNGEAGLLYVDSH